MNTEDWQEVRFDLFCKKCVHCDKAENEEPCNECLEHYKNFESHRPVCYKEKNN